MLRSQKCPQKQIPITELVRPYIFSQDIQADYKQMAQDESRESEALEWVEATIGDVSNELR